MSPVRFQVDPDFYDHPKSIGLSDAAVALWVRAGSYCAAKLTDGFVPDNVLPILTNIPESADELVRHGLWKRNRGGFFFHEWRQRNLLRARVEADRKYDRERMKRLRGGGSVRTEHETDVGAKSEPTSPRRRSLSVSGSVSVSGSEQPPTSRKCKKHIGLTNPPDCGDCAEARKAFEEWHATRRDRVESAPKCPKHRGQLADNCAQCRGEALGA